MDSHMQNGIFLTREVALCVDTPVVKSEGLDLIPWTHPGEERTVSQKLLSYPGQHHGTYVCVLMRACAHAPTHIHTM